MENEINFGGGARYATTADVERGFFQQTTEQMLRNVNSGVGDASHNLGCAIHDVHCDTKHGIDGLRHEIGIAAWDIKHNSDCNALKILEEMHKGKVEELRDRIRLLELQNELGSVVRYPTSATYSAGYRPFAELPAPAANA